VVGTVIPRRSDWQLDAAGDRWRTYEAPGWACPRTEAARDAGGAIGHLSPGEWMMQVV